MLNISKNGQSLYILYGSKNYGSGRTVTAEVRNGSNATITGSPFTLTEIASTGLYGVSITPSVSTPPEEFKIKITEDSTARAHASVKITEHDIDSVGGNVVSIKDIVENVTYGNSALNNKLVDIEGSGFATGTDSLKAIKDYLVNTIQSSISGISNNINTAVALPTQMLRPTSGSSVFKSYVNVYDSNGNMEDPDDQDAGAEVAMVAVNVVDESGNDRNSNLGGLSASTQDSKKWLTRDSQGRFSFTYSVSSSHDIEQLLFSFSYEESAVERITDRASQVTDVLDITDTVNSVYSEVTNATYGLSALKTLVDSYQTANQTDLTNIETKIDTVDTVVDSNYSLLTNGTYGLSALQTLISGINTDISGIQTDLTSIQGSGFATGTDSLKSLSDRQQSIMGTGFDSGTDTLEKIRDAVDGIDVGNGGYIA